ncbi:hypothetical protein BaRGS_00000372 [Batillaria attramentaria]|uniref:Uncharacterized protein n=1 Tax=Batillaria attramentaria TaxID=370345 RepID=A0ABD0M8J1_9CAEN
MTQGIDRATKAANHFIKHRNDPAKQALHFPITQNKHGQGKTKHVNGGRNGPREPSRATSRKTSWRKKPRKLGNIMLFSFWLRVLAVDDQGGNVLYHLPLPCQRTVKVPMFNPRGQSGEAAPGAQVMWARQSHTHRPESDGA